MNTLRDRLAELADDAPTGGPYPLLWERGRRLSRRRRVGTAVIVTTVVVALALLGTLSWQRSEPPAPAPAGSGAGLRLPDEFFVPGDGIDGTVDTGPIGPLTAVLRASRHDHGPGLVGVSGATGEYRFLDLPGWVQDDQVALSADGARVAYWYGGRADSSAQPRIDGLAVYDTATGEVSRHPIDSDHGVQSGPLVLVDDEVWFEEYAYDGDDRTAARGGSVAAWQIGGDVVRTRAPSDGRVPALEDATSTGTTLVEGAAHQVRLWSSDSARAEVRRTPRPVEGPVRPAPTSSAYAAIVDPDGPGTTDSVPRAVTMLLTTAPGRLRSSLMPGLETNEVAGWRSDTEIVTFDYRDGVYSRVALATGSPKPLTRIATNLGDVGLQVAADAWGGTVYDAPRPPDPLNPWVVRGAAAGVVIVGAAVLLWWRRRVRA